MKHGMLEAAVRTGKCAARPPDPRLYSWLAPELLASRTCLARVESDVYSLCCVIWELVHNQVSACEPGQEDELLNDFRFPGLT